MGFSMTAPAPIQPLRGSLLNPLHQRLLLYRFAHIEIHPGQYIEPLRWGLPYLQQLRGCGQWHPLLHHCFPFRELGQEPVISPSLNALLAVRQRQPSRPLLFCRPAYACPPRNHLVARLARATHLLAPLLRTEDASRPIRWLPTPAHQSGTMFFAYYQQPDHPLDRLLNLRFAEDPAGSYSFQEDGQLIKQDHFDSVRPNPTLPEPLVRARERLESLFRAQLQPYRGTHYVCAADQQRLLWFERDCLRLLPKRFRCLAFPETPHPQDPFTYFILVHDPQIRLTTFTQPWPILHLDGDERTLCYRSIRQTSGPSTWSTHEPPQISARFATPEGLFRFQRKEDGWYSHEGGNDEGEDRSKSFATRVLLRHMLQA